MHDEDEVIEKNKQGRFDEEKNGLLSKETFTQFILSNLKIFVSRCLTG